MKRLFLFAVLLGSGTSALAATRLKTIEYAFPQSTVQAAAGGVRYFTNLGVYIPEQTERVFTSVVAYVHMIDSVTAAASPTSEAVGLGIGAVAYSTTTVTDTITNSGEAMSFTFLFDYTSYFNTNFLGSSATVHLTNTLATSASDNASAKLIITYKYDDAATTQIKTVRIPIQSSTFTMTTSLITVGGGNFPNNVPLLDDYLPEASKTYRDIFFEYHTNERPATAGVDPQLSLALDAEAASSDGTHESALASARYYYGIWKRTDMATSSAHTLKAATTNTNMSFDNFGALLVVTYEYDATSANGVFNSVMLPAGSDAGYIGGSTSADASSFTKEIIIAENNPVLKQSGVLFGSSESSVLTLSLAAGAQSYKSYIYSGTQQCGGQFLYHNINVDNGFAIRKGSNTFTLNWYSGSVVLGSRGSFGSGVLYLNYTSDKSSMDGGAANHLHTVISTVAVYAADGSYLMSNPMAAQIPELNYWLEWQGYSLNTMQANSSVETGINVERKTGEGAWPGWEYIDSGLQLSDPEMGSHFKFSSADKFKHWPLDPYPGRMDAKTYRRYRIHSTASTYLQALMYTTYRTSTFTVTGTVSGYTGDGSGLTVTVYRSDTGEYMGSATTAAGGTFTFIAYQDGDYIFGSVFQDATHKGRSVDLYAGATAMDISLAAGAAATTKGFSFIQ